MYYVITISSTFSNKSFESNSCYIDYAFLCPKDFGALDKHEYVYSNTLWKYSKNFYFKKKI